jgi:hypothetical protein
VLHRHFSLREIILPGLYAATSLAEGKLVHKKQIRNKFFFINGQHDFLVLVGTRINLTLVAGLQR